MFGFIYLLQLLLIKSHIDDSAYIMLRKSVASVNGHVNYLWNAPYSLLMSVLTWDASKFIKRRHRTRIRCADVCTRGFSAWTDSSLIRDDSLTISEIIVIRRKFAIRPRDPREKRSFATDYYFHANARGTPSPSLPNSLNFQRWINSWLCLLCWVSKDRVQICRKKEQHDHRLMHLVSDAFPYI